MKDILPKHDFQFIVEHHDANSVTNQHKHLIINFRVLRNILSHAFGRIVILGTTKLTIVFGQLIVTFL